MVLFRRISFETVAPKPTDELPRMDVAAFVGLAASGPIGIPVAIEDEVAFETVFGTDLALAWNEDEGRQDYGHLAASVRAFFANGGRRCLVVRAGPVPGACSSPPVAEPKTGWAPVPGLVEWGEQGASGIDWRAADRSRVATVVARSAGSWFDDVEVGAVLRRVMIARKDPDAASASPPAILPELSWLSSWDARLEPGDLLRFVFRQSVGSPDDAGPEFHAYRVVPESLDEGASRIEWGGSDGDRVWFERRAIDGTTIVTRLRLPQAGDPSTVSVAVEVAFEAPIVDGSVARLDVSWLQRETDSPHLPQPGMAVPVMLTDGARERDGVLVVRDVRTERTDEARIRVHVLTDELWSSVDEVEVSGAELELVYVERLTFDLLAHSDGRTARLDELGFAAAHPRAWSRLVADQELYDPDVSLDDLGDRGALRLEPNGARRFAVASFKHAGGGVALPFGMDDARAAARVVAFGDREPANALVRDGLDGGWSEDWFVDRRLADTGPDALLAEARFLRYIATSPSRLCGLHALLFEAEPTLIAIPDATLPKWTATDAIASASDAGPQLRHDPTIGALTWDGGATEAFVLAQAADTGFSVGSSSSEVIGTRFDLPASGCPGQRWFRVRRASGDKAELWSNTITLRTPARAFGPESAVEASGAVLRGALVPDQGLVTLDWTGPTSPPSSPPSGVDAVLEIASDPEFGTGDVRALPASPDTSLAAPTESAEYYRVTSTVQGVRLRSNVVRVTPARGSAFVVERPDHLDASKARTVHKALVRMCHARQDATAVLSVPCDHRAFQVTEYVRLLDSELSAGGLDPHEVQSRDFASVYHPWCFGIEDELPTRPLPPDGFACGLIAGRTRRRGAWISPENELLRGLTSLTPALAGDGIDALRAGNVNVIVRHHAGFSMFGADTISPREAVRSLCVRRLLILLRRLAIREGDALLFQGNTPRTRRRIERRFRRLLAGMFERGAFSGRRASDGFVVDAGEEINIRPSVDAGMLIVELRVAPSRPLEFLCVRLLQSGSSLVVEEATT